MRASADSSKRVVAVLGMHRSGTSAITSGLRALDIELGNELLQGQAAENPRGFFEDEPLLEISNRVLRALGIEWDSSRLIAPSEWKSAALDSLRLEAAESIERRFGDAAVWGFKNPRSARLLPFWQSVFSRIGRSDSYVIALRNPLSVARSLQQRNGFGARRSYTLWLIHQVLAVTHTKGRPRVCVDYDLLVEDPARQLERIAEALDLPAPSRAGIDEYRGDQLSADLRHTRFDEDDLGLDPELPALARRTYEILRRWASDQEASSPKIERAMRQMEKRLLEISPLLTELDALEARVREERGARGESEREWAAERERYSKIAEHSTESAERLRQELARMTETLEVANGSLKAQEGARDSVERRLAALEKDLEVAEHSRIELQEGLEVAERSRIELQERCAGLVDEAATLREEREKLRRVAEGLRGETGALQSTLRAREADIRGLEGRIDSERREARDRAAELKARLVEAGRSHDEILTELDEIRTLRHCDVERLETRLAARERELEDRLQKATAAHQASLQDAETWAIAGVPGAAASIRELARAMGRTRTWRAARALQRGFDRLRGSRSHDALHHVAHLAEVLEARSSGVGPDLRELAAAAGELAGVVHDVLEGEIMGTLRMSARSARRMLGLAVDRGPAEQLLDTVVEIAYFLDRVREGPFETDADTASAAPGAAASEPEPRVDVVVPVHGARDETRRCLESLLRADNRTRFEIVVIDDGNRDPKLLRLLEDHQRSGRITLLRNDENVGFPLAANRGILLHPERDVVLLNSDTRVSDGWLDRLRRAAQSDWKIATVTPFSNDAEICSFPIATPRAPAPSDEELRRIDALALEANRGRTLSLPTAVGFCVYVTRESLREVGLLDAVAFGRGYGEESDFSMRARAAGYRNVLAADVYVAHEGNRSFGPEREERLRHAAEVMAGRHPHYAAAVQRFLAEDPARPLRRSIEAAQRRASGRPRVLMISHARGGGTQHHIDELSRALAAEGVDTLLLRPAASGAVRLDPGLEAPPFSDDMTFDLESETGSLAETLCALNVRHVHFHHVLDLPRAVTALPERMGVPFDVTLHDYYGICPRLHLVDGRNRYCGEPDEAGCRACVERNGSELGPAVDIAGWRASTRDWLASARRIFVPSSDTAARFARYFPDLAFCVRPHPCVPGPPSAARKARRAGRVRHMAVVGAINAHKGSDVLLAVVRDADERRLPLRFTIIGHTDVDNELRSSRSASVWGRYDRDDLPRLLERSRCDVAFLPSRIPETFCYALAEVSAAGLHPVAFAVGAQAERIREDGWGQLLALDLEPSEINDALLALVVPEPPEAGERDVHDPTMLRGYYDGLELE